MRKTDISSDLSVCAFDFFYWFSRFEFALKENDYLKSRQIGANAEPGWREFIEKWAIEYQPSAETHRLISAPPARQIISDAGLDWQPVGLHDCQSDLEKVVRLLKTVRNNLFHGGKHGEATWSDPERTRFLLETSKAILDQLAKLASIEADYTQYY
jgi:hypothetical protein